MRGCEGGGGGACEECTHKCKLIHGRKDPSPIVVSFFKIIVANRFSSALFIPPKFAPTMLSLVDQQTYLENSSGQQWKVNVSIIDGHLAFQQGWHKFALDHSLEIGDLVLFHYIIGSHFVVQVYGKSGCEKSSFSVKSNFQREKSARDKVSMDHLPSEGRNLSATKVASHTIDKSSMNNQGSSSTVHLDSDVEIIEGGVEDAKKAPKSTEKVSHCDDINKISEPLVPKCYTEVPFYMIDRDTVDNQGANRNSLFDLSNFEMLESASGADGKDNEPVVTEKFFSEQSQTKPEKDRMEGECNVIDKEPAHAIASRRAPLDMSGLKMLDRKCKSEYAKKVQLAKDKFSVCSSTPQRPKNTSTVGCDKNEKVNLDKSNGAFRKGKDPVFVKVEHEEMLHPSEEAEGNDYEEMETGNLNSIGLSSPNAVNFCCSAPSVTQHYLELPTDLSSFASLGRIKMERKIVLVRDPAMRVWPVIYHERAAFKVLSNGWEALAKANNIKTGDVCTFGVENESEGRFHVRFRRGYVAGMGKVLYMDNATDEGSRLSFARVCVEIRADSELPRFLKVKINNYVRAKFRVEYDWYPPRCSTCLTFGHSDAKCPIARKAKQAHTDKGLADKDSFWDTC